MSNLIRLEDVLAIIDKRTVKGKLQVAREVLKLPTIEPRCEECGAFNKTRLLIPQRKKGKWLYDEERCATGIYAICSACDESIYQTGNFRYCPNCGADMTEGEG